MTYSSPRFPQWVHPNSPLSLISSVTRVNWNLHFPWRVAPSQGWNLKVNFHSHQVTFRLSKISLCMYPGWMCIWQMTENLMHIYCLCIIKWTLRPVYCLYFRFYHSINLCNYFGGGLLGESTCWEEREGWNCDNRRDRDPGCTLGYTANIQDTGTHNCDANC